MVNSHEDLATARWVRLAKTAAGFAMVVAGIAAISQMSMQNSTSHERFMEKTSTRRMFTPWFLQNPVKAKKFNDELEDYSKFETPEGYFNLLCEAYQGIDHPNQKSCCPKSCGAHCGTKDCHKGDGGETGCCEGQMKVYCSQTTKAPCWLNITLLAEVFEDESCLKFKGMDNPAADACCHPQCGEFCGDENCHLGPGGREKCCKEDMKRTCGAGVDAPCVLPKKDEIAPLSLTYPGATKVFSWGDDVKLTPKWQGRSPNKWYSTPALPDGLLLDGDSGDITGKLSTPFNTEHVFTITGEDGTEHDWTTYDLRFLVKPAAISYHPKIKKIVPEEKVDLVPDPVVPSGTTCSVHPALPVGLMLDKSSCAVRGTVSKTQNELDQTYVVTAKNEVGQTTSEFKLKAEPVKVEPMKEKTATEKKTTTEKATTTEKTTTTEERVVAAVAKTPTKPTKKEEKEEATTAKKTTTTEKEEKEKANKAAGIPWLIVILVAIILLGICLYCCCRSSSGGKYVNVPQEESVHTAMRAADESAGTRSWWREEAPAPEEEEAAIAKGVPVASVERAKDFVIKSTSPTQFQAQPAAPEVTLTWKLPDGQEKVTVIRKKPLGLKFPMNEIPIKIAFEPKPGTQADLEGIKVGWILTAINDTSIQGNMSFYEIDTMLHTVVGMLPKA